MLITILSWFNVLTSTIFKVNDKIKNRKTGKIGIVTKVYQKEDIIKYHLIGTPNCIHTFSVWENRFDIIKGETNEN